MNLSNELLTQFAKITNDNKKDKKESTIYGTTVDHNGSIYVRLDGSDLLTPILSTADAKPNERVTVMIKNHTATITGNMTSPAARSGDVVDVTDKVKKLQEDNVVIKDTLAANKADISDLKADNATIKNKLTSNSASIEKLETESMTIATDVAELKSDVAELKTDVAELKTDVAELKNEIPTVLRIESSRGIVFKNNQVSTVLSAVIYKGSKRITDILTLKSEYGDTAYLEWSWQRLNEDSFGTILSTDSRISNDGFNLTLSPEDVDTKVTFMCKLITA